MVSHNRQRSPMHSRRCMDLISCDRGSASDFCASYLERARCVVGMALGHFVTWLDVLVFARSRSEAHAAGVLGAWCVRTCLRSALATQNDVHTYGFSPLCVRSCVRWALATEKHLPHYEHTCGFSCGPWGSCPCRMCGSSSHRPIDVALHTDIMT